MIATDSDLFRRRFQLRESQCTIISDLPEALEVATSSIKRQRNELEDYIRANPVFKFALRPLIVDEGPEVVRFMSEVAQLAGVGPMAAVAGVLADLAVEEMLQTDAKVAIVEDGGEASIATDRPIDIALKAGDTHLSERVGFRLDASMGVATSSGLFSHALSLGKAEAATIFADNAGLADAAATAVANEVKGEARREVIEGAIDLGLSIKGVRGVFILFKGLVGMGGELPAIFGVDP
jgi:ApbE superfamily uncharacterized protein (UPF0280 family)